MSSPSPPVNPTLRLVTATINVKHGALNNNVKFNTNLPLNYAMWITRVQFILAVKDAPQNANTVFQILSQLTENTANVSVSQSDPLAITNAFFEERILALTAVAENVMNRRPIQEQEDDFNGTPWPTLAQTLNLIASAIELVGTAPVTNGVDVFAYVWYYIAPVTPALQNYLSQRLALQR